MKPKNQAVFRVMGVEQSDPGGETNTQRTFSLYHIGLKQSFLTVSQMVCIGVPIAYLFSP